MSTDGSVTLLLHALKQNEPDAISELWQRYFMRLRKVARHRLGAQVDGPFDSEDVALSAFNGFCRAFLEGSYPTVDDREGLWAILVQITWRKAKDYRTAETAQKRTRGLRDETALEALEGNISPPEIELMMAEECQQLFDQLQDESLVKVAVLKLEGWTNEEIATELGYTRRTIQRMLVVIRGIWQTRLDGDTEE